MYVDFTKRELEVAREIAFLHKLNMRFDTPSSHEKEIEALIQKYNNILGSPKGQV